MKTYTDEELKEILRLHKLWSMCQPDGKMANLSWSSLSGANLSGADLSGSDLFGANLFGANLSGANLYGANLSGANLFGANLSGANLSGANLSWSNLSWSNLSGANLYGANLSGANLFGVRGKNIITATLGRRTATAFDGYIRIGCKYLSIDDWIVNGKQIGLENGYTKTEIKLHMAWIKYVRRIMQ